LKKLPFFVRAEDLLLVRGGETVCPGTGKKHPVKGKKKKDRDIG